MRRWHSYVLMSPLMLAAPRKCKDACTYDQLRIRTWHVRCNGTSKESTRRQRPDLNDRHTVRGVDAEQLYFGSSPSSPHTPIARAAMPATTSHRFSTATMFAIACVLPAGLEASAAAARDAPDGDSTTSVTLPPDSSGEPFDPTIGRLRLSETSHICTAPSKCACAACL